MVDEKFKFIKQDEVRVRIAPSPTGLLHIGTARVALFNFLFAKKNQGAFIVRIEDTDIERSDPRFEKDILDSLRWLGLEWDEGPIANVQNIKPSVCYRQSERKEIYKIYLEKLLNENKAYFCFCSENDLEAQKQYLLSIGEPPRYSGRCSQLSKEEIGKYLAEGKTSIIRFRVPAKKVEFEDIIRGKIEFDMGLVGDIAIAKDLYSPLYNFACVVDDFEMKISHVIRGEDHISNTPKQILIQEVLGFPSPKYAHLPLILGPDRSKLSKRHGSTSIAEYRKQGYLPETLVNFMAFLGWNPGTEREIYSLNSLIKEFSLEKVQKGGAVFNIKRLDFLNGFYIRQKSPEKLTELCLPYLIEAGLIEEIKNNPGPKNPELLKLPFEKTPEFKIKETGEIINLEALEKIVKIYQERLKKLSEISELTDFFFKKDLEYDKNLLRWKETEDRGVGDILEKLEKILSEIKDEAFGENLEHFVYSWNKENLEKILIPEAEKISRAAYGVIDRGYLLWPFRVALTGKEASAGPFEVAEILGKDKCLKRIKEAKEKL